jgi:hypothetical protein
LLDDTSLSVRIVDYLCAGDSGRRRAAWVRAATGWEPLNVTLTPVATFHGIPGADPPGAHRWVEHVLRVCVVAGVLGVIALMLGWLRAQDAWTPWLIALPGIAGPLLLLPWWWAPERRSADDIIMIRTALIPSVAVALATRSLGVVLGVLLVIALDLLAPRIASPAFQAAGVPAGRLSAFSLWRHRRRVLAADRATGQKHR